MYYKLLHGLVVTERSVWRLTMTKKRSWENGKIQCNFVELCEVETILLLILDLIIKFNSSLLENMLRVGLGFISQYQVCLILSIKISVLALSNAPPPPIQRYKNQQNYCGCQTVEVEEYLVVWNMRVHQTYKPPILCFRINTFNLIRIVHYV